MSSGYLGAGGRLTGGPAPELVASGYAQEIAHAPRLARAMGIADRAHAVVLVEAGVLAPEVASRLLAGLRELDDIPADRFPWDPALGDAFNSREAELTRRIGADAAGWLSAGRPRREAFRVALRLVARDGTLDLHDRLLDVAAAFLAHARDTRDALAADYTYLQPAQPTTIGHLMLAYAYPVLRDAERIRAAHRELAKSVAGAGGSAGSRWPIDRRRLAELLGGDDIVVHARDAAWQVDVYVQVLSAIATATMHGSQLGQDLEILASQEFSLVELADRHSRASALMPQKRNPYALAVVRTMAGTAAGELSGVLVALHTGSARTDHFHALNGVVPRVLDDAVAVTHLLAEVVAGMRLNVEAFADVARRGFTQAADVADVLSQSAGIDYRTAHHVMGRAVRVLVERGGSPDQLTPSYIADAAEQAGHGSITIDAAALQDALDPEACTRTRLQEGGSAPGWMAAMLDAVEDEIASGRDWSAAAAARGARGRADLDAADERIRTLDSTPG
ncbi:MAG: argininosuccinate lyase [Dehalococcoidia bacterium]|nr:argininosuccinate lyase [Dehalococcoidia bacterium]